MNYYAGLDVGGTNGRLKLCGGDGTVLGEFQAPGCSVNTDGYEKSRQRCRDLVLQNLEKLNLSPIKCRGICAAISGVDSLATADSCRDIFAEMGFHRDCLEVVNDCEIFLYLSKGPAIVLTSGTGSICYGRDSENHVYRTGGWNHIISDEGSGFDLGLKVLMAAANDMDGRRSGPLLTDMVIKESGLDTLEKINDFINRNLFEKSRIAKFAQLGGEAARQGDLEALRLHKECAEKLYALVADTLNKMHVPLPEPINLWLWGSILVKNDVVQRELVNLIHERLPKVAEKIPPMSALDTALVAAGRGRFKI